MTLGKRIRQLRKERNMTLVDLAGGKITKGMLSLIENDKSQPSMTTLSHIAKKLDVSIGYLTREGDEEWTRQMLAEADFSHYFSFPFEHIEKNILPHLDRVSQDSKGMDLYNIIRIYYRYKGEHATADEYTEKIGNFYRRIGIEHLVVKNRLNDAISLMYSQDYTEAYNRLVDSEAEVMEFKAYDPHLELEYVYLKGIFSVPVDMGECIPLANRVIELSYDMENFKYFFSANMILGYYYGLEGDMENHGKYEERLKQYLQFNSQEKYELELIDADHPITVFHVLVDDAQQRADLYEAYVRKIEAHHEAGSIQSSNMAFYHPLFLLEMAYFKKDYKMVVENYREGMYIRSAAQHPIDRIIMATRSCIYPLSLHHLGEGRQAREAFERIEETIEDIKHSVFTKEFSMIRDIIFEENRGMVPKEK
ncbi:helix-turn-helix domain-containing protein [Salinicoccus roseus]|uniref:helix-turn-helix domain-containing protein n=1 Tax=Salinicoccus roseus TaxID=45670 RepID=UPI0022FFC4F4|nr:helix-turn-helix transcriptional regulator [Salinicoccus roseus]